MTQGFPPFFVELILLKNDECYYYEYEPVAFLLAYAGTFFACFRAQWV